MPETATNTERFTDDEWTDLLCLITKNGVELDSPLAEKARRIWTQDWS